MTPGAGMGMGDGSLEVTVPLPPLRVSVKLGERAAADELQDAREAFHSTVADLFRP